MKFQKGNNYIFNHSPDEFILGVGSLIIEHLYSHHIEELWIRRSKTPIVTEHLHDKEYLLLLEEGNVICVIVRHEERPKDQ